jgi:RimJ/RimL family protein N-acetyltransferase
MKIATLEDFNEIEEMAMKFIAQTGYTEYADVETISQLIYNILTGQQNEMIILLQPGVGMIAGMSTPFPFGPHLLASEIVWWINEDKRGSGEGKELIEAFEYWAKEKAGCTIVTMTSLDDNLGKYYEKKGYKLYERAYMKEL